MEINHYFDRMKELHALFLIYINNPDFSDEDFEKLIGYIRDQEIPNNREKLQHFLKLLLQISNNHHRYPLFISKIEKILNCLQENFKQYFTSYDLFNIFNSNKFILLYLIKENVIQINDIIDDICDKKDQNGNSYFYYFIPEITNSVNKKKMKKIEIDFDISITDDYEEKRKNGVNDSYISSLIRDDLIDDFISYIHQKNISLNNLIEPSIFETNSFLNENDPTLIEYATFYGSIKILQYLKINNVKLMPSLWLYSVHSQNPEIFSFLEENKVSLPESSFNSILEESIKCHHNDFVAYILDNMTNDQQILDQVYETSVKYFNYSLFPDYIDSISCFFSLSINNPSLINSFLEKKNYKEIDIKESINEKNIIEVYCFLLTRKRLTKEMFSNSNKLKKVIIPPSIKSINDNAFENCSSLTHVVINYFLQSIGSYSFHGCSSLKEITIPSFISSIGTFAFSGCSSLTEISIPSGITSLPNDTFSECKSLKYVYLPSSLKTIRKNVFSGCISLMKIILPSSLVLIGDNAFYGCKSLKKINIPTYVTSIGKKSFMYCSSLLYISCEFPYSLSKIEADSFLGCGSVKEIKFPNSLKNSLTRSFSVDTKYIWI